MGSTPAFWMRLQMIFDLAQVEARADTIIVNQVIQPQQNADPNYGFSGNPFAEERHDQSDHGTHLLLTLEEPQDLATRLHVAGTFEFTEDVIPDPLQTKTFESV
jgi:hypothetical protein